MIYDLVCCFFERRISLDNSIHHLVSIVGIGAGLAYEKVCFLMELQSPFWRRRFVWKFPGSGELFYMSLILKFQQSTVHSFQSSKKIAIFLVSEKRDSSFIISTHSVQKKIKISWLLHTLTKKYHALLFLCSVDQRWSLHYGSLNSPALSSTWGSFLKSLDTRTPTLIWQPTWVQGAYMNSVFA